MLVLLFRGVYLCPDRSAFDCRVDVMCLTGSIYFKRNLLLYILQHNVWGKTLNSEELKHMQQYKD